MAATLVAVLLAACGSGATGPSTFEALDPAFAQARLEPNLKSLVVGRNGAVVRAEYFNGGAADTPEYIWSVTKSVLALAVGAALDTGCLTSLDQTLGELLGPALVTDPAKAGITLRHLLTMTSGIDFPESATYAVGPSLYQAWIQAPDQVAFVMARTITAAPGARFEYGSGTIHLVSVALTRACGSSTAAFAQEHLFTPLEVTERSWETDHQGYQNGGAGLSLAPDDMLAIGNLVLGSGRVQGRQIIPATWVTVMTSSHVTTPPGSAAPEYGYGSWLGRTRAGDRFWMATGWGGQFIIVLPAKGLVVTAASSTAGLSGVAALAQWQRVFDIIDAQVIPRF